MRRLTLIAALFLAGVVACGSNAKQGQVVAVSTAAPKPAAPGCAAGAFRRMGSSRLAFAGVVRSGAVVRRRPGGAVLARFGRLNVNGVPTVFSIRGAVLGADCRPSDYLVQIARRPNGVTGWVPAGQVSLSRLRARIVVDLSQRRVTLYRTQAPADFTVSPATNVAPDYARELPLARAGRSCRRCFSAT